MRLDQVPTDQLLLEVGHRVARMVIAEMPESQPAAQAPAAHAPSIETSALQVRLKDVAELLGIGETTLRTLIAAGEINPYEIPGVRAKFVRTAELQTLVARWSNVESAATWGDRSHRQLLPTPPSREEMTQP